MVVNFVHCRGRGFFFGCIVSSVENPKALWTIEP